MVIIYRHLGMVAHWNESVRGRFPSTFALEVTWAAV